MSEARRAAPPDTQDTGIQRRQHERFEVRRAVRFLEAQSFVEQYAHNLSEGGLFVVGAQHLKPLDQITVEIDLPGFASYQVVCKVAHLVDAEEAVRRGTQPGAGLAIMEAPTDFRSALTRYLAILGGRKDELVLLHDLEVWGSLLERTGFRVAAAGSPAGIAAQVAELAPLAVVVPASRAGDYQAVLAGEGDLVLQVGQEELFDSLLNRLDQRVFAARSAAPAKGA